MHDLMSHDEYPLGYVVLEESLGVEQQRGPVRRCDGNVWGEQSDVL